MLFHTVRAGRLPADALPVENAFCAFSHCEGRETARRALPVENAFCAFSHCEGRETARHGAAKPSPFHFLLSVSFLKEERAIS